LQAGYLPMPGTAEEFRGLGRIAARLGAPSGARKAPWIDRLRTPRLKRLYGGLVDRIEHYAVPAPYPAYASYARHFCAAHRTTVCIDYADPALLAALDDRQFWGDRGHLSRKGAELYTRWLAARYVELKSRGTADRNGRVSAARARIE